MRFFYLCCPGFTCWLLAADFLEPSCSLTLVLLARLSFHAPSQARRWLKVCTIMFWTLRFCYISLLSRCSITLGCFVNSLVLVAALGTLQYFQQHFVLIRLLLVGSRVPLPGFLFMGSGVPLLGCLFMGSGVPIPGCFTFLHGRLARVSLNPLLIHRIH